MTNSPWCGTMQISYQGGRIMENLGVIIMVIFVVLIFSAMASGSKNASSSSKEVKSCVFIGSVTQLKSDTKTKTGSAIGRGVVGGALLGPAGAIIGASTAKKKTVTKEVDSGERKFLVEYTDGTRAEETAKVGTNRYNYLMSKLKM